MMNNQSASNNPSLAEYIGQAFRSNTAINNIFGPDFIQKQIVNGTFMGVNTDFANVTGDIFTATFGRKVWQALNNQVKFFNALPKTEWGNTVGWRVRTSRGRQRTRPVLEAGGLPNISASQIDTVTSFPKIVASMFGVTIPATFIAQLEGGAGDVLGMEMSNTQQDHLKGINESLVGAGAARVGAIGIHDSTTAMEDGDTNLNGKFYFTFPVNFDAHFQYQDRIQYYDIGGTAHATTSPLVVISSHNNRVTIDNAGGDLGSNPIEAGDIVYVYSRSGPTSIEDTTAITDDTVGGGQARTRAYDLDASLRAVGHWSGAVNTSFNNGVGRDLTLPVLDSVLKDIRIHGGEPKLLVTNHDQYYRLERLLQAHQRYLDTEEYQVGVGAEKTFPGTRGGMRLATYQGIPILPDADIPFSIDSNGNLLGSTMHVLDTDYIDIGVALPTTYIENRDYINAGGLVVRGLFYTFLELRVRNLWVQGAIRDLNP